MMTTQNLLPLPSNERKSQVFADEFHEFFGNNDDSLKEDLRSVDGVPNAAYLVTEGKVFVFAKLVQKVKEHRKLNPDLSFADLARSLIPLATIPAKEAVEQWNIMPEPYELMLGGEIRHRPFNTRLPGVFQNEDEAREALAQLLLGGVLPGAGDFTYRGQAMTLREPLALALLPLRPTIQPELDPAKCGYNVLGCVGFESGFEPVSKALFDQVKELETTWRDDSSRAARYVHQRANDLWARAGELRLDRLNDSANEVPDYGTEDFAELRPLYTELPMLCDGSLYAWFDVFQTECCYINGWMATRDDDFLFYLLGKIGDNGLKGDAAKSRGEWIAYSLLRGQSFDAALEFAQASAQYDEAIAELARRLADAMHFLVEDKKATDLRGRPITTMADMFRTSRKFSSFTTPVVAEQDLSTFNTVGWQAMIAVQSREKFMLDQLTDPERQERTQWMDANPGINGMYWPGWCTRMTR